MLGGLRPRGGHTHRSRSATTYDLTGWHTRLLAISSTARILPPDVMLGTQQCMITADLWNPCQFAAPTSKPPPLEHAGCSREHRHNPENPAALQIEAVWHTGVVIDGRDEVFFGYGISKGRAGATMFGQPARVLDMG